MRTPRSTDGFTTLDDFLGEEGTCQAFQAFAVKKVAAYKQEKASS
jgi:hypothetical protein